MPPATSAAGNLVGVVYTCPNAPSGFTGDPATYALAGHALIKNLTPARYDVIAHPAASREAAGEVWWQTETLEGTPAHLSLGEIEEAMRSVSGVRRVHDLHVWTLTSEREAMSAHVVVDDVRDSERLLETLHAVLHARFGIDHTTIQLETAPPAVLRIQGPTAAPGS